MSDCMYHIFFKLPRELRLHVLDHLALADACALSLASKACRDIAAARIYRYVNLCKYSYDFYTAPPGTVLPHLKTGCIRLAFWVGLEDIWSIVELV